MGYKYGVWLVYDSKEFTTTHVGHFTITCYMEKEDAYDLYNVLKEEYGEMHYIDVECKDPIIFNENMYEDDDNNMGSWGYGGKSSRWNFFKDTVINRAKNKRANTNTNTINVYNKQYNYNFSPYPHTSIEYVNGSKKIVTFKQTNKCVLCKLEVADITGNDPSQWKIITNNK
jgi:hypothetical protein